jgi:hypothetical protein
MESVPIIEVIKTATGSIFIGSPPVAVFATSFLV